MYHEVLHAYLDFEKFKLGNVEFENQFPGVFQGYDYAADGTIINRYSFIEGHQQVGAYLTPLNGALSSYDSVLSNEIITALAKAGITTMTPTESLLNKNERDTRIGNSEGTKCP